MATSSASTHCAHVTEAAGRDFVGARPLNCDPHVWRMTVMFQAQRVFYNLMEPVQGGMLTAMLDLAMAFAVLCTLEDGHVVPSLESNLLATASATGRIRLRRPMNL